MKKLSNVFGLLAVLLSNVMCAVVAYNYCDIKWGIRYAAYSAPTYVAFLCAIPYLIGIIVCVFIAVVLGRKER
jgi:hypothetical protein